MKRLIICSALITSFALSAMRNNQSKPVRFASPEVLHFRLSQYDKKHGTNYAESGAHQRLGNTVRYRSEADIIIKACLLDKNHNLTDTQLIENKRNIMIIFNPDLVDPARL